MPAINLTWKSEFKFACFGSILILIFLVFFSGCGSAGPVDERFFGSWRYTSGRASTIITFRANGTWASDVRISDRYARIVEKKGSIEGTWSTKEGILKMTPLKAGLEREWKVGKTYFFDVIELTKEELNLKEASGRIRRWVRVRGKQNVGKDGVPEIVLGLGPIVVNVRESKAYFKERYLCVDLKLVLEQTGEDNVSQNLHPRVREAALLHLSSLTYNEINTMEQVERLQRSLKDVLNPYMKGRIERVDIDEIAVTSKKEIVEEFLEKVKNKELPKKGEEEAGADKG
jgi:flagellar basal body-associated protein FliL